MPGSRWRFLPLIPLAALFLLPLWQLLATSLQPTGQPLSRRPRLWPEQPDPANYAAVFDLIDFGRFALNSTLVCAVAVPLSVLVAAWAGYAMARLPAGPRRWLIAVSLVALMIPVTAIWLPRFILFQRLGLLDTRLALAMPALAGGSPFYVLLFFWTFARQPRDLIDAARLDGAGPFEAWRAVAMPLARPTTVAVAMLAFIAFWGNFIDPLLFVQSVEKQTLPYGLHLLHQLDSTNWPLLMAAAVMTTAPTVAVFLALQRYFLDPAHGADWFGR